MDNKLELIRELPDSLKLKTIVVNDIEIHLVRLGIDRIFEMQMFMTHKLITSFVSESLLAVACLGMKELTNSLSDLGVSMLNDATLMRPRNNELAGGDILFPYLTSIVAQSHSTTALDKVKRKRVPEAAKFGLPTFRDMDRNIAIVFEISQNILRLNNAFFIGRGYRSFLGRRNAAIDYMSRLDTVIVNPTFMMSGNFLTWQIVEMFGAYRLWDLCKPITQEEQNERLAVSIRKCKVVNTEEIREQQQNPYNRADRGIKKEYSSVWDNKANLDRRIKSYFSWRRDFCSV